MEDYPSNRQSKKDPPEKEGEKKVEQIVSSEVIRRKKPMRSRFAEIFGGGDARTVTQYVFLEVLVPAMKDTIADVVSQGIERLVYGEARSTSRRTGGRPGDYTNYSRYSKDSGRRDDSRTPTRRARATHDFSEIILKTRVEADEVLDKLFDLLLKYDSASVRDLYDLVGITPDFTDERWGWTDIRTAKVRRIRHGYLLDLPEPEPLD